MASSVSLSILEVLVNLGAVRDLDGYIVLAAELDQALVTDIHDPEFSWAAAISRSHLDNLSEVPRAVTQQIGDIWVQNDANGILSVPSAVLPGHRNSLPKERIYVFSPRLIDGTHVVIRMQRAFKFDPRLSL
jgi:hypothetical protein